MLNIHTQYTLPQTQTQYTHGAGRLGLKWYLPFRAGLFSVDVLAKSPHTTSHSILKPQTHTLYQYCYNSDTN